MAVDPQALPPAVKQTLAGAGPTKVLDVGGALSSKDVDTLQAAVDKLHARTGSKVWVVAVPKELDVGSYAPLFADLGMGGRDVLLVFHVGHRSLRCGALKKEVTDEVLEKTRQEFQQSAVPGVVSMLREVGDRTAATTATVGATPPRPSSSAAMWVGGAGVLTALVLLVLVLLRRRGRDATLGTQIGTILDDADKLVADTIVDLGANDPRVAVSRLLDRGNRLQQDLAEARRLPVGRPALARAETLRAEAQRVRGDYEALDRKTLEAAEQEEASAAKAAKGES